MDEDIEDIGIVSVKILWAPGFSLSILLPSVYWCCLPFWLQDLCSSSRHRMQAQPYPLNVYGAKPFHKALRSQPVVKLHWPGLNYMSMTYHKEGQGNEYFFQPLSTLGGRTITARRQRDCWAKKQLCLPFYSNLQVI